eukprot:m.70069 g.70069  ORF g.70069 m.70069 type:complete len:461 (+) comp7859_c0_seq1:186-1568(+)
MAAQRHAALYRVLAQLGTAAGDEALARSSGEEVALHETTAEERDQIGEAYSRILARAGLAPEQSHVIPRFFFGRRHAHSEPDPRQEKLRELARVQHLSKKTNEAVNNDDLEFLWRELESLTAGTLDANRINYEQFDFCRKRVAERCPKLLPFFAPSIFMSMIRNGDNCISINQLFDFVMLKVSMQQVRFSMCLYDYEGYGYLRENDLQNYILDEIQMLPKLANLDEGFYTPYSVYACRKFFFFLDPKHTGKIKILDILTSDILAELTELKEADLPAAYENSNWFSTPCVSRIHSNYVNLDLDGNGLLSPAEFAGYNDGSLNPLLVERIYQECVTYSGELDYKGYLDFVLAKENPNTPQALSYFFKLLDIEQKGYLTTFSLNYFWKGLQSHQLMAGLSHITFADVKNEIFDMVRPADPYQITLKDLINCKTGATAISIITDMHGLLVYENRENISSDDEEP